MLEPPQLRRLISNGNQLRRHGNVTRRNSCISRDHNHRRRDLRLFAALCDYTAPFYYSSRRYFRVSGVDTQRRTASWNDRRLLRHSSKQHHQQQQQPYQLTGVNVLLFRV